MWEQIELPLTIEGQLERYMRAERHIERHEILWHTWHQNKRWITQLLEGTASSFPTYSRHDASHAETVLHNIELILGEDRISKLSASDCFVILHSVYIHDIGMTITASERKEIVSNEKFMEMVDYLEEEGDGGLKRAVRELKRLDYTNSSEDRYTESKKLYEAKLEVYEAIIKLIANYRRSEHGEKTKERLYQWTLEDDKLGIGFSLAGMPQRIFLTIAECARFHTESEFNTIMKLPQEDDGYVFDYIHPRLISVLLQLGDILDIDNDRFHPLALHSVLDIPETSWVHFRKHLAIRRLHIRPDIIEIAADCDSQETLRLVRKECDMLKCILQEAGYAWSSICPVGFPGALPIVKTVDLYLKGEQIPQDLVTARFVISQKKAFEILEGSNLYQDRFAFLREFLQNAIDATKLQYWKEYTGRSKFYEKGENEAIASPYDLEKYVSTKEFPIKIEMEICKKDRDDKVCSVSDSDIEDMDKGIQREYIWGVNVKIKDFGIGISQEDLRRISRVGSHNKNREEIRDMPSWLKPTAEFGIGLQSAFLITRIFKCSTHTRTEERYEITFGSGANAQYDGYINVNMVERFKKEDTYGTCFEIFVPESKKMRHEQFPNSWNGEDMFDISYRKRQSLRHSAELMSQMTIYLDSLIGETSLFPIHLKLIRPEGLEIPVNTKIGNQIRALKLELVKSTKGGDEEDGENMEN